MLLRGLGILPQTERSLVRFLIRAHAWFAGQVPGWGRMRGRQSIDVSLAHRCFSPSLSTSLPLSLKVNKIFKKNLQEEGLRILYFTGVTYEPYDEARWETLN